MVFEDGLFHADLHPGNLFVIEGGQIGLIDFGKVGTVDERTQQQLAAVLLALGMQDSERLTDTILGIAVTRKPVNRMLLQRDLQRLVSSFHGKPLKEIAFGAIINDALAIVRRYYLQLPSSYSNLFQSIVMLEGICTQLDPDYNLVELITPYTKRLIIKQHTGESFLRRLGEVSTDWAHLGMTLPQQLQRILDSIERGQVEVGLRPATFDPVVLHTERIVNRLVLGILVAALIIGLSIVLVIYHPVLNQPWSRPSLWIRFRLCLPVWCVSYVDYFTTQEEIDGTCRNPLISISTTPCRGSLRRALSGGQRSCSHKPLPFIPSPCV